MKVTEEGTDALFQQYSIKEIQDIEKKLRHDIEKKKEDLRQMVGERYQDLINAADTINEMKTSTESITKHIGSMETWCGNLYTEMGPSGILQKCTSKSLKRHNTAGAVFVLAAHLKLLMDVPSIMWWSLDRCLYLRASQVLCLAEHVHLSLSLDAEQQFQSVSLNKAFPILPQQMASIRQFRSYILKQAWNDLKKVHITEEDLVDIVCSILLLEETNLQSIFQQFLRIRMETIKGKTSSTIEGATIRNQICDLFALITNTVILVKTVFLQSSDGNEPSLLSKTFNSIISSEQPGAISFFNTESSPAYNHLPQRITDFHLTLQSDLITFPEDMCREATKQWIKEIKVIVHEILEHLLCYITTVKGLAAVSDAVDELMKESRHSNWSELCRDILEQDFIIYNELLQSVLVDRIKVLCQERIGSSFFDCQSQLLKMLNTLRGSKSCHDVEKDLTKYVWVESPNDLQNLSLGMYSNSSEQTFDTGYLAMKANAYTPQVQSLCSGLDKSIANLLEDFNHFGISSENKEDGIHEQEMAQLRAYAKDVIVEEINKIMKTVQEIINGDEDSDIRTCYPFLSRFGRGLTDLCPNIKSCFIDVSLVQAKKSTEWDQVKSEILVICNEALRKWGLYFVKQHLEGVELGLNNLSPSTFLRNCLEWDEIEIDEETEDGKTVKSIIRVPMQTSQFLSNALFNICQEINKSIGHVLTRPIVQELRLQALSLCLTSYELCLPFLESQAKSCPRFAQMAALQLLFDVEFLAGFFPVKEQTSMLERTNRLVMSLEALVDPFDLDVFHPAIQTNLSMALQRSSLLLGLLCQDRSLSIHRPAAGHNQAFNLLPATVGVGRFMTLPVASSKVEEPPEASPLPIESKNISTPKLVRGFGSSPSLQGGNSSDSESSNVTKSYSFFSAMGASWFGGSNN